jgi:ubiquinone/menaquinone biosynthesis C-methylase UbiE
MDDQATALTRVRYQRISGVYDRRERFMEWRFRPWRKKLWELVEGQQMLEVGVGTGKNIEFWPADRMITAIDLTPGMLKIARERANQLNREDDLRLGDVQCLDFPDNSFDTVVATFVFCSVPDPVQGLSEVRRVVKPGGQVLLLEHMRSAQPVIGLLMDLLNPWIVRTMGANINRRTVENVHKGGLVIENVGNLGMGGVFKLIVAGKQGFH